MTTTSEMQLSVYLEKLSARTSTPGGGAAAAVSGAQGCALLSMVANFTIDDKTSGIVLNCGQSIEQLLALADADAQAFKAVMQAYKGKGDLQDALTHAAKVPASVIECLSERLADVHYLAEKGNPNLITDIGIAALLFHTGLQASTMNIRVNLKALKETKNLSVPTAPDLMLTNALELADSMSTELLKLSENVTKSLT